MSKTVDERVVSMQFDNRHFESNVQTTMNSLDKLKQKLDLRGASKGLENINDASKNVNMSALGSSIEAVRTKFSALEVMGVTALANITNSAVNAGKRILSALTIDPVKTGFHEYELKMDSVKTIMASTGESIETVNKYLNELNEYSDQTIYSFSDMTQNIGKFTNAGVKLEDAVMAIKGISNEAAVSGANATEASRAMYNFAQALSSGYVKLIDWKSIENANMATVEFKQQLIDTALALGTVTSAGDGMYKTLSGNTFNATQNFNDVLQDQWMTSEVLVGTLKNYADETTDIGKKAKAAAQEVTKFSQIFDIAKETAQSGWAQTWETLFGDINKAKAFFTPISEGLNKIIEKMSNFRNTLLKKALDSPFAKLAEKIAGVTDATKEMAGAMEDFSQVVQDVINGKWGNGQDRWDALTKAGYDWAHIQNLVNEELGCSVRHSTDYGKAQKNTNEVQKQSIAQLIEMSDAQLEANGWTKEEIKLLRQLEEQSEKTGIPIEELVKDLDQLSGRNLLINGLKNVWASLVDTFNAVKKAWQDVFPPKSIEERAEQLYGLIQAFHKFTLGMKTWISDAENADKVTRTFKGLFAAIDLVTTLVGGPLKIAFKIVRKILSAFGLDIWDVTANIGDAIVAVNDWVDSHFDVEKIFKTLINLFNSAKQGIQNWIKGLRETDNVPKYIMDTLVKGFSTVFGYIGSTLGKYASKVYAKIKELLLSVGIDISGIGKTINNALNKVGINPSGFVNTIKTWINSFRSWIDELKKSDNIPRDIILGLINGLSSGVSTVYSIVIEIGSNIIKKLKEVLDIHSPSDEMFKLGEFTIQGFIDGLLAPVQLLYDTVMAIGEKILEIVKNFDLGQTIAALISGGIIFGFVKLVGVVDNLTSPLGELGDLMENLGETVKKVGKSLSLSLKASAIKTLAVAIAILVASVIALTFVEPGALWASIGAIAAIAAILGGLSVAVEKFGSGDGKGLLKIGGIIMGFAAGILILAIAIKMLNSGDMTQGIWIVAGLFTLISGLIASTKLAGKDLDKIGSMMLKLSLAFGLMALVVKIMGGMDTAALIKGGIALAVFGGIMVGLIAATKLAGGNWDSRMKDLAGVMTSIAAVFLAMTLSVKILGGMDREALIQGGIVVALLGAMIVGLIAATKLAGGNKIKESSDVLLGAAAAILAMGLMVKLLGGMEIKSLIKGVIAVAVLGGIIAGLILLVTRFGGEKEIKLACRTILAAAAAIAIMGALAVLMGLFDFTQLAKGVGGVAVLTAMLAIVINQIGKMGEVKMGPLIAISIMLAILAGTVITLSFLDPAKVAVAAGAIALIMGIFTLLVMSVNNLKDVKIAPIIILALVIAEIAAIIAVVAGLEVESAIQVAGAISILLGAMTLVLIALGALNKLVSKATSGILALALISLVVGLLIGMLALMNAFNVDVSIEQAIAISILLTVMAGVAAIAAALGAVAVYAMMGIAAIAVVVLAITGLIAIMGKISQIPGAEWLITEGGNFMQKVGTAIGQFIGGIAGGIAQGISSVLPQIGNDLSTFITNATPFIEGIKMVDASVLAGAGFLAGAILALTVADLLNGIVSFLPSSGGFAQMGLDLSAFMVNALPFIMSAKLIDPTAMQGVKMLAEVILTLTAANVLQGLTSWFTGGTSISAFADELGPLGKGIKAFSDETSGINVTNVTAAAEAAKSIAQMTQSIPKENGVMQWLAGETSISGFADDLKDLGKGLMSFSTEVEGLNPENVNAAVTAAKAIADITQHIPAKNGVAQWFTGETSLSAFGDDMKDLAIGLMAFSTEVTGLKPDNVEAAVTAAKAIADITQHVPASNGVAQWFAGESSLATLGEDMKPLGKGLKAFSDEVAGLNATNVEAAVTAAKAIADITQHVPASNGVAQWFTGDKSLSKFAGDLQPLGAGMAAFSSAVTNLDPVRVESAVNSAIAICNLANCNIGAAGGLPDFAKYVKSFGETIAAYFIYIRDYVGFDAMDRSNYMVNALNAIHPLANWTSNASALPTFASYINQFITTIVAYFEFINQYVGYDAMDRSNYMVNALSVIYPLADWTSNASALPTFASYVNQFGADIGTYFTNIGNISGDLIAKSSTVVSAISNVNNIGASIDPGRLSSIIGSLNNLVDFIRNISSIDANSTDGFVASINNLSNVNVTEMIEPFQSAVEQVKTAIDEMIAAIESKGEPVKAAGEALIGKLAEGVTNNSKTVSDASSTVIDDSVTTLEDGNDDFASAGGYVVEGFASGISKNTFKAAAKAKAMAKAAIEAAKKALDINSPSKEFEQLGQYIPEGMAIGIEDYSGLVSEATAGLGNDAIEGFGMSLDDMNNMFGMDFDSQPTITPVMDLSGVESGISDMNGMFSSEAFTVDTSAIGSASSMMSGYQNGNSNDEVVKTLEELRKDIADMPRESVTIGGITYDDGSNIFETMKDLVRIARVERRA